MEKYMDYDFDINLLSQKFINDYPAAQFPELMHKQGRPYSCLLIDSHDGYLICIPFRSSINHKNSFMFKGTQRAMRTKSGLDYSKIVLIKDTDYLDNQKAIVDKDEYRETIKHLPTITADVIEYIETYIDHVKGLSTMHPRDYARKYKFSTLKYFHDIMNI